MTIRLFTFCVLFAFHFLHQATFAQQVPESDYRPTIAQPEFALGTGPRVAIDGGHNNFHQADGRYRVFAELLRMDGFQVDGLAAKFDQESLRNVDVLVIANALNERNKSDWSLPTPSAFTSEEIAEVQNWVRMGGSLFLIADHMPFPGAAAELAKAFQVEFSNGYAQPKHRVRGKTDVFDKTTGLIASHITRGRRENERITQVATFGGSAFVPPQNSTPIILFQNGSTSYETTRAPGITPDAKQVNIEGWCQGAVFPFGLGRVAVFGEAAMFTAQSLGAQRRPMGMNAPDAAQNYQLVLNTMHWLVNHTGSRNQTIEAESMKEEACCVQPNSNANVSVFCQPNRHDGCFFRRRMWLRPIFRRH